METTTRVMTDRVHED